MVTKHFSLTLLICALAFLCMSTASAEGTASASMLSDTCLGCHGPDGISAGPATPTISGMSEVYIIGAMLAYKYDKDIQKKKLKFLLNTFRNFRL